LARYPVTPVKGLERLLVSIIAKTAVGRVISTIRFESFFPSMEGNFSYYEPDAVPLSKPMQRKRSKALSQRLKGPRNGVLDHVFFRWL